jgi:hypothetical protein
LDEKERGSGKLLERGQREIFLEREYQFKTHKSININLKLGSWNDT